MEIYTHRLANGIRLVHKPVQNLVAHLGFIVHTGSRDELPEEHGMAHFIEHVIFKGTRKRKAWHILSRLEDVGGEINAYTTKEDTCIYAAFIKNDYERAMELIYDICFHSVFPEKEIQREKNIILDEILSYKDSPSDLIFDEIEEHVYNQHAIGRGILGNENNLKAFRREDIFRFMTGNYATDEMVVSSVGNIPFENLVKLAEKYFGQAEAKSRKRIRIKPNSYDPRYIRSEKKTHQVHCMIGNIGYDASSPKRYPLALLNNILGGPGMNSRLNITLREKSGIAYNVESHYTAYSDTGILMIYFACEKEKFAKSLKLVHREMELLKEKKLGTLQLSKARKQLIGQIAVSSDNNEHLMLSNGKNMLVYDRVESLAEVNAQIETITAGDILEVAREIFTIESLTTLEYY